MSQKEITVCLTVLIVSMALVGCTRAKPEITSPTLAATPAQAATATQVVTPQAPPAQPTSEAGPTVITVAEASPTTAAAAPAATATALSPTWTPVPSQFEYVVEWQDTLYAIAYRFGTTVEAILALNNLASADDISVGQILKITGTPSQTSDTPLEYTVQLGDTLFSIAQRFGTTVDALGYANGIVNPWFIHVGQKLIISQGSSHIPPSGGDTYVVQAGDTLYGIAARFGKNVWDIIVANNLPDPHWISVGQVLVIP